MGEKKEQQQQPAAAANEEKGVVERVTDKVERDGLGKTVVDGIGSAGKYSLGVAGNMLDKSNAVDASIHPGKAMGQSMLMGLGGFLVSMLLGNGLFSSLGLGFGCGVMGQEIKTMAGNIKDTFTGKEPFSGRKFLTSALPLLLAFALSSKLGPAKAVMTTILGGALGSRVSNIFLGSNLGERYYGDEFVNTPENRAAAQKEQEKPAADLEKGKEARPEIAKERHDVREESAADERKAEIGAARDSVNRGARTPAEPTGQDTKNVHSVKM